MERANIDEQFDSLFEPIGFVLDGKDYTVGSIPATVLESLLGNVEDPKAMRENFAHLVGKDPKEFAKTDFRKISIAMGHINKVMAAQIEAFRSKNAPGESVSE